MGTVWGNIHAKERFSSGRASKGKNLLRMASGVLSSHISDFAPSDAGLSPSMGGESSREASF